MKELLIFAGTTEGRELSQRLAEAEICHTLCVATEYGEIVLKEHPLVKIHQGRMDREKIKEFILEGNFTVVVDATHPYARIVTQNIKDAIEEIKALGIAVSYFRLKRETLSSEYGKEENIACFETNEACADALKKTEGNILLTTGSRELSCYCAWEEVKSRLYARVIPSAESISLCMEQGICGKHIIAMQGPFTTAMNEATIRQYGITVLVTKESGVSGGFPEKLEAAQKAGIKVFVIGRPEDQGYSFTRICRELEGLYGRKILQKGFLEITLAGIGMGSKNSLTKEVRDAVYEADILLGAERMLASYQPKIEKRSLYQPQQIIPYLKSVQEKVRSFHNIKVVVLFSGDSGFYSGCQVLYRSLEEELQKGELKGSIRILPGVSSVAALAACVRESYQDAVICSIHGKPLLGLIHKIERNPKIFLLTSGVEDVNRIGEALEKAGMEDCEIWTGFQLSYENQQVRKLSPRECMELKDKGLYVCMIKNPRSRRGRLTHGMTDENFIREKIPMSKEEVREISICKLQLYPGAVVYDIGSGTGSVAVEMAGLSDEIQVYAIERKKEAALLIEKNKKKFGLENITIVEAQAPEGLDLLPPATHAFIGGSGGRLREILEELYRRSPGIRIVITAVTLETISEIRECLISFGIKDEEMVQVQVSRVKEMGNYHMLQGENPVWICSFQLMKGGSGNGN